MMTAGRFGSEIGPERPKKVPKSGEFSRCRCASISKKYGVMINIRDCPGPGHEGMLRSDGPLWID